jgi:hypothetical protein
MCALAARRSTSCTTVAVSRPSRAYTVKGANIRGLAQALERGELAPDADLDLLVDIGFGTVWYRRAFEYMTAEQLRTARSSRDGKIEISTRRKCLEDLGG